MIENFTQLDGDQQFAVETFGPVQPSTPNEKQPMTHDVLRQRLLSRVLDAPTSIPADGLRDAQWSREFERLMRNRLLMGAFRYGPLRDQVPNGYDNIGSAIQRLRLYQAGGNLEHLVDAANLCLVEFVTGQHPQRHFESADDGIHTEALR